MRCSFVYQHVVPSPSWVIRASELTCEFWSVNPIPSLYPSQNKNGGKWCKPMCGYYKVNTDAGWNHSNGRVGIGVFIRDDMGRVVVGDSTHNNYSSANMGELLAIGAGLRLASEFHCHKIIVESDALEVINTFEDRGNFGQWRCFSIIKEIKRQCSHFADVKWEWVSRVANAAAHATAKMGNEGMGRLRWADIPPPSLVGILKNDGCPNP